jgi:uncharacterized membrane protein SirB2
MYPIVRDVHVACVAISGAGFALRWMWALMGSPLLAARAVRVLPHLVDTVLLTSAAALSIMAGQYPLVHGWLTAKVLGLVLYIGLGTVALRRGRTRGQRARAGLAAMLVFGFIVSVALSKRPAGFLHGLFGS